MNPFVLDTEPATWAAALPPRQSGLGKSPYEVMNRPV